MFPWRVSAYNYHGKYFSSCHWPSVLQNIGKLTDPCLPKGPKMERPRTSFTRSKTVVSDPHIHSGSHLGSRLNVRRKSGPTSKVC